MLQKQGKSLIEECKIYINRELVKEMITSDLKINNSDHVNKKHL